jgi:hypothetical protein
VVEEREALEWTYAATIPTEIALEPFLEQFGGNRELAVPAAAVKLRERVDAAVKNLGFSIRQQEFKPAKSRGALWRWVCSCIGGQKAKATLETRAPGEPEQQRRDRPHHGTNCKYTLWFEETDTHITMKGSELSVMSAHNHQLLNTVEARAAWGPTRDHIPRDIFDEAINMQNTMQPPPSVATIAKFLTDRESAATQQKLTWSVKQFQNELAPDAVSVALDTAKFLQMLHATANEEGARVAPPAPQRARTPHR